MSLRSEIVAGIVLFNPENGERFVECINQIVEQVECVYVFDNSTNKKNIVFPESVVYITENENKGIAYALNRIMEAAKKDGYGWVITIDQDSVLPTDIVKQYKDAIGRHREIGIVCPQVIDFRRKYMIPKTEPIEEFVEFCITSGSCTSIDVWEKIGGFDEWLFIDLVDNEFCKRLVCSGYKILMLNSLVLNQEFGKIIPKSPRKQKFWIDLSKLLHNENIAKFSYKKFVSPMRVYYTNRNIIYVNRKMKNYGLVGYKDNYNCKGYVGFLISFCLPSLLRAQNKRKVLMAIFKGMCDGKRKKVDKWQVTDRMRNV